MTCRASRPPDSPPIAALAVVGLVIAVGTVGLLLADRFPGVVPSPRRVAQDNPKKPGAKKGRRKKEPTARPEGGGQF